MKLDITFFLIGFIAALLVGYLLGVRRGRTEGFNDYEDDEEICSSCHASPCGCGSSGGRSKRYGPGGNSSGYEPNNNNRNNEASCPPCPEPDPSRWVLKSTVPPCPPMPDMSKYMLKTECPPQPDMSKYVLKSSVPNCPPCISTCSKPCKIGECPPCPRPRCPVVQCPEPKACPACPTVQCAPCPEPDIKCKATYEPKDPVRPMLASTSTFGF